MGRPKTGESGLGRQAIVDAALQILDAHGLEDLSLARVASALKVQTPSLYHHFSNKAELYTYMGDTMLRQVLSTLDPSLTGRELLWAFGLAKHARLRTRRDAAKFFSTAGVSDEVKSDLIPALLARVSGPDLSPSEARLILTAIQALALGWAIFESNPATSEVMRHSNQGDAGFESALAKLVFGTIPKKAG